MPKCHRHLLLNGFTLPTLDVSIDSCKEWLDSLVPKINMKTLSPAQCFDCDDEGNEGITGIIVITTSHAAFHYWSTTSTCPNRLSFCLYSCDEFDNEVIIEHIDKFWGLSDFRYKVFDRSWEITEKSVDFEFV